MSPSLADDRASLLAALDARNQMLDWAAGAEMFALVRLCAREGWLTVLAEGCDVDVLAERVRVPAQRAEDVLLALLSGGVVMREDDRWALTETFAALLAEASGLGLESLLAWDGAQRERLEEIVCGRGGDSGDPEFALAVARFFGPRPTEGARGLFTAIFDAFGPLRERWSAGGRHLDVGCGVGGGLLCVSTLFPEVRAVGIELVPEVAEEARRRARDAGVADRVEVRSMDARALGEVEMFDTAFWAHPFFAADSRADVLAAIHRALVPGGMLLVQELHPPPADGAVRSPRAALDRALRRGLGLPGETSAEQLVAETEAAGFVHELTAATPRGRGVLTRRP